MGRLNRYRLKAKLMLITVVNRVDRLLYIISGSIVRRFRLFIPLLLALLGAFLWLSWGWQQTGFIEHPVALTISEGGETDSRIEVVRTESRESGSTTVRNIGLLIAAIIVIPFWVWRARTADSQVETGQLTLLNDSYKNAVEKLDSQRLRTRLAGIVELQYIAESRSQYHVRVMRQLCEFTRHPTEDPGEPVVTEVISSVRTTYDLREDMQAAMKAIASLHEQNLEAESAENYWMNLQNVDLREANLCEMDLSAARVNFTGFGSFGKLLRTDTFSDFRCAKLHDARLLGANLSGVDLSGATGLTEFDLYTAKADEDRPPKLDDAIDLETKQPLDWLMIREKFDKLLEQDSY